MTDSESDGEGPSTPQPVSRGSGQAFFIYTFLSSPPCLLASGRVVLRPLRLPGLGAVLALWFGSYSRTMYSGFYPLTNHITCVICLVAELLCWGADPMHRDADDVAVPGSSCWKRLVWIDVFQRHIGVWVATSTYVHLCFYAKAISSDLTPYFEGEVDLHQF